jgi:hypothetical protein
LKHTGVKDSANRSQQEQAFLHVLEKRGKHFPVKPIWIPQIKECRMDRLNDEAAASTINKEKAALSKMFQCLIELRHVDMNPARLVKALPENRRKDRSTFQPRTARESWFSWLTGSSPLHRPRTTQGCVVARFSGLRGNG